MSKTQILDSIYESDELTIAQIDCLSEIYQLLLQITGDFEAETNDASEDNR